MENCTFWVGIGGPYRLRKMPIIMSQCHLVEKFGNIHFTFEESKSMEKSDCKCSVVTTTSRTEPTDYNTNKDLKTNKANSVGFILFFFSQTWHNGGFSNKK